MLSNTLIIIFTPVFLWFLGALFGSFVTMENLLALSVSEWHKETRLYFLMSTFLMYFVIFGCMKIIKKEKESSR